MRLTFMRRRIAVFAMATLISLSAAGRLHAAPLALFHHSGSDKSAAGKLIHFNIRNGSSTTIVLKAGDQQYTIEPGKSLAMQAQDGVEVIAVSGSSNAPGAVVTKVSPVLQGNTLVLS
jgi:hypothetical protein